MGAFAKGKGAVVSFVTIVKKIGNDLIVNKTEQILVLCESSSNFDRSF